MYKNKLIIIDKKVIINKYEIKSIFVKDHTTIIVEAINGRNHVIFFEDLASTLRCIEDVIEQLQNLKTNI